MTGSTCTIKSREINFADITDSIVFAMYQLPEKIFKRNLLTQSKFNKGISYKCATQRCLTREQLPGSKNSHELTRGLEFDSGKEFA